MGLFKCKKNNCENEETSGKKIKLAILGYGGRGKNYANIAKTMPFRYEVIAVIENNLEKLAVAKDSCHLNDDQVFASLDAFIASKMQADYLAICTQDADHVHHAIPALEAGYDLLLEKPIACSVEDCVAIYEKAVECKRKVAVCHVLRYSTYYEKMKEVIDSGVLGKIVAIDQVENVNYWHQAHSYVRGDWRRKDESTPMVIAKTCHDLDIAVYLADSECDYIVSNGKLNFFRSECAPEGATEFCMGGCKAKENCPYDAEKIYIDRVKKVPAAALRGYWPQSRLMDDGVVTIPKLREVLKTSRYGKCVFLSDNDVVDYQVSTMVFKNGITSTLIMTAFSNNSERETRVRGTLGEIIADVQKGKVEVRIFGKKGGKNALRGGGLDAHGGGDRRLMVDLAKGEIKTDIKMSIESHLMGFAAEMSRLEGGKPVKIDDLRKSTKKTK